jgi:hypothetical protein
MGSDMKYLKITQGDLDFDPIDLQSRNNYQTARIGVLLDKKLEETKSRIKTDGGVFREFLNDLKKEDFDLQGFEIELANRKKAILEESFKKFENI